jgi:hypothetical protein
MAHAERGRQGDGRMRNVAATRATLPDLEKGRILTKCDYVKGRVHGWCADRTHTAEWLAGRMLPAESDPVGLVGAGSGCPAPHT